MNTGGQFHCSTHQPAVTCVITGSRFLSLKRPDSPAQQRQIPAVYVGLTDADRYEHRNVSECGSRPSASNPPNLWAVWTGSRFSPARLCKTWTEAKQWHNRSHGWVETGREMVAHLPECWKLSRHHRCVMTKCVSSVEEMRVGISYRVLPDHH